MHPEALYSFITMGPRSSSWEPLVKIEMATNIFSLSKKVTLCEKFYLQLLDSLSSSSSFSVYLGKAKTISRKTFWIETFPCYTFSSLYFHFSFQFFFLKITWNEILTSCPSMTVFLLLDAPNDFIYWAKLNHSEKICWEMFSWYFHFFWCCSFLKFWVIVHLLLTLH